MDELKLYFVGWRKHDSIQMLVAGPYVASDAATAERRKLVVDNNDERYVVCSTTLPFTVTVED